MFVRVLIYVHITSTPFKQEEILIPRFLWASGSSIQPVTACNCDSFAASAPMILTNFNQSTRMTGTFDLSFQYIPISIYLYTYVFPYLSHVPVCTNWDNELTRSPRKVNNKTFNAFYSVSL